MSNNLNVKNTDSTRQDSPEISALYSEALIHEQAGRMDPAYQLYRKILESNPEHADSLHRLGMMAEQMGKHETALDFFSRAIEIRGNDPLYYNHLGNTLSSLGKLDEAVASYQRALYLKDDFSEAYNNLGNIFKKQGKNKEAAEQYALASMSKKRTETTGMIGKSPVTIGRYSYGIDLMTVRQWDEGAALNIGSFCSFANCTIILGGNHVASWMSTYPFGILHQNDFGTMDDAKMKELKKAATNGDVTIGSDVWIGLGATIMSGVTIGHGAIIAANAHVVKDVKPYEIVGGNPARVIRKRFSDEIIDLLLQLAWWDLPIEAINDMKKHLLEVADVATLKSLVALHR